MCEKRLTTVIIPHTMMPVVYSAMLHNTHNIYSGSGPEHLAIGGPPVLKAKVWCISSRLSFKITDLLFKLNISHWCTYTSWNAFQISLQFIACPMVKQCIKATPYLEKTVGCNFVNRKSNKHVNFIQQLAVCVFKGFKSSKKTTISVMYKRVQRNEHLIGKTA